MNLMSSTLLTEDTGVPFDEPQAEQSQIFRGLARFGKSFIGEPDKIAADLANDAAVAASDTLLVTVPNQLGVDYNTRLLAAIAEHVGPAIGWEPAGH